MNRTYEEFYAEHRAAMAYDPLVRCDGCGQMRRKSTVKTFGRVKVCRNCRGNYDGSPVGEYPRAVS